MDETLNLQTRKPELCDEVRGQLSAYMLRELGDKQSRLVHEHLRLCESCRVEASSFEQIAALLRAHDGSGQESEHLSEKRMARIRFTALHPVWDWVYYRHRFVSVGCAIVLVLLVILLLRDAMLFREPDYEGSIPIWRMFRSGRLPELVEEAARARDLREAAQEGTGAVPEGGAEAQP
jgi:hypothetical protein